MRVFMTGASGFIGSSLVPELVAAGHQVVGLSRSGTGARMLARAGADVVRGDVNDLALVRRAADEADGVVHAAFDHGSTSLQDGSEGDRLVVEALGDVLRGSSRPLVVSSGTGLVRPQGRPTAEDDDHYTTAEFPRAATEEAADELTEHDVHVIVVRLSQVHDTRRQGRITRHVDLARRHGRAAYVGDGTNRVAAVHVSDAVALYRAALERGRAGGRYHAVGEEGVPMRAVAEAIGTALDVPTASISADEAAGYFGPMAHLAGLDLVSSAARTRAELDWRPAGPGLVTDLQNLDLLDDPVPSGS